MARRSATTSRDATVLPVPSARVALIGAGTIAAAYVDGLRATPGVEVVAVCTRSRASAAAFAREKDLEARTLDEVLADPAINYVLNLTPAAAHAPVTRAALEAGKSVYSEKPLASDLATADQLIAVAEARGLLLACGPATFCWPPYATARRLLAQEALGRVRGALSLLVYPGPEIFHPRPAALYSKGSGPLHDMGVYQITALIDLLGPVTSVQSIGSRARDARCILVGPDEGRSFPVTVPTHVHALMEHESGALSSVIVSFDAVSATAPRLELFGEKGGLELANAHSPGASLALRLGSAPPEKLELDPPVWSPALFSVGPSSAWTEHHRRLEVTMAALRARDTLAVLLEIERCTTMPLRA